jgi:hypothetical protein
MIKHMIKHALLAACITSAAALTISGTASASIIPHRPPTALEYQTTTECARAMPVHLPRLIVGGDPQLCEITGLPAAGDVEGEIQFTQWTGPAHAGYRYQVSGDGRILAQGYAPVGHRIYFTLPRGTKEITVMGDRDVTPYYMSAWTIQ